MSDDSPDDGDGVLDAEVIRELTCDDCGGRGRVVRGYGSNHVVECPDCDRRWSI